MILYRFLLGLAAPFLAVWFALRLLRQRESMSDLAERLGFCAERPPGSGEVLWLHGASNGELTSARALIAELLRRRPALEIVVTSNSVTGRDMVRGWQMERLRARMAPLDYRPCLNRFLRRDNIRAIVFLEGDLWPNRLVLAGDSGLPVAMVSARISKRSFGIWRRLPRLTRRMLRSVTLLSAQDDDSERCFRALGLPEAALRPGLTLKSSVRLSPPDPDALEALRGAFDREATFLAASTHDGEEERVIAAFSAARARRPELRMILAPRHPSRGAEVAALLSDAKLAFATRSAGEVAGPETDVLLADTLGEMPLWYSLAGTCFVGGSLVDKGGHTPFEPAQFGCAILHGPYLSNFAAPYAALAAGGGAVAVGDTDDLAAALAEMTPDRRAQLAGAASLALNLDSRAAFDDLARSLLKILPAA